MTASKAPEADDLREGVPKVFLMTRPKIKTVLNLLFGGMALTVVILAAFSLISIRTMHGRIEAVSKDTLPSVQLTKEMDTALSDLRIAYNMHIIATDEAGTAEANKAIASERKRFLDTSAQYAALASDPKEVAWMAEIQKLLTQYISVGEQMVAASASGDDQRAKIILQQEMRPLSTAIAAAIDNIVEFNLDEADEASQASAASYGSTISAAVAARC